MVLIICLIIIGVIVLCAMARSFYFSLALIPQIWNGLLAGDWTDIAIVLLTIGCGVLIIVLSNFDDVANEYPFAATLGAFLSVGIVGGLIIWIAEAIEQPDFWNITLGWIAGIVGVPMLVVCFGPVSMAIAAILSIPVKLINKQSDCLKIIPEFFFMFGASLAIHAFFKPSNPIWFVKDASLQSTELGTLISTIAANTTSGFIGQINSMGFVPLLVIGVGLMALCAIFWVKLFK